MNKKNFAIAVAAALVATKAFALTQNVNSGVVPGAFLVGPPPSGGQQSTAGNIVLTVPQFNLGGNFTGVSYTLSVWTYASYAAQNFNQVPTAHFVTWALDSAAFSTPNGAGPAISTPLYSQNLGNLPVSPAPGSSVSGVTGSELFVSGPTSVATAPYLGAGTVNFVLSPNAISSITGSSGNSNPDVFVAARVDVVYTYNTDVPEASTYAAGVVVLAGAGFMARRRMLAAK